MAIGVNLFTDQVIPNRVLRIPLISWLRRLVGLGRSVGSGESQNGSMRALVPNVALRLGVVFACGVVCGWCVCLFAGFWVRFRVLLQAGGPGRVSL
jgi:hypothetical protein